MPAEVKIHFNGLTDVVSAYLVGTRAARACEAPSDTHLILELDERGHVVGVQLLGASALVPSFWTRHPDRSGIPSEILGELDRWLSHRWADLAGLGKIPRHSH